jgi:hypothetical protein
VKKAARLAGRRPWDAGAPPAAAAAAAAAPVSPPHARRPRPPATPRAAHATTPAPPPPRALKSLTAAPPPTQAAAPAAGQASGYPVAVQKCLALPAGSKLGFDQHKEFCCSVKAMTLKKSQCAGRPLFLEGGGEGGREERGPAPQLGGARGRRQSGASPAATHSAPLRLTAPHPPRHPEQGKLRLPGDDAQRDDHGAG